MPSFGAVPCSLIKMLTAIDQPICQPPRVREASTHICVVATVTVQSSILKIRHIQQCNASANVDKMIILCYAHGTAFPVWDVP